MRETIEDLGGTMPEDLPTPQKSIKQIEREQKKLNKKLKNPQRDYHRSMPAGDYTLALSGGVFLIYKIVYSFNNVNTIFIATF